MKKRRSEEASDPLNQVPINTQTPLCMDGLTDKKRVVKSYITQLSIIIPFTPSPWLPSIGPRA